MDSTAPEKTVTTSSKSTARRAFGELTPNARLSPQKSIITSDKTQPARNLSPLKQARSISLVQDENAHSISKLVSQMTGRKRSIDEVEDAVAHEHAPMKRVDGRDAGPKQLQAPALDMQASAQLVCDQRAHELLSTFSNRIVGQPDYRPRPRGPYPDRRRYPGTCTPRNTRNHRDKGILLFSHRLQPAWLVPADIIVPASTSDQDFHENSTRRFGRGVP